MWVSRVVYRARLGDTGAVVRCSSVQSSPAGSILYTVGTNSSVTSVIIFGLPTQFHF